MKSGHFTCRQLVHSADQILVAFIECWRVEDLLYDGTVRGKFVRELNLGLLRTARLLLPLNGQLDHGQTGLQFPLVPNTRGGGLDHGSQELDQLVDNPLLPAVLVPQVLHLLPELAVLLSHELQLLVEVLLSVLDVADLGEHLGHLLGVDRHDLVEAPGGERHLPLDLLQQMLLAALKEGVGELHLLPLRLQPAHLDVHDLVEVVHVQLADEGGHVGVFVVVRQQGLGELRLVLYNEGFPLARPANEMI